MLACSGWLQPAPRAVLAAVAPDAAQGESPTQLLPLFPLGIVAFPGELVFLHIFEPRYRQLITESAERGIHFGIVTIVPGGASSIGTETSLERILRTDEAGNMDVATRGLRAFQLSGFQRMHGKLYSGGLVSFKRNDPTFESAIQRKLVALYNRTRLPNRQRILAPYPENLSFLIGHDVDLSRDQELQLLTMEVERDRQRYLLQHLRDRQ